MTAPAGKTHQEPALARLGAEREQRRIARDFRETRALIEAAVGPPPELLVRLAEIEVRLADQAVRIEALEALSISPDWGTSRAAADPDCEDGRPMPAGNWEVFKCALEETGFSATGLRKRIIMAKRSSGRPWWWYRAGRLWIDLDHAPRKRRPA